MAESSRGSRSGRTGGQLEEDDRAGREPRCSDRGAASDERGQDRPSPASPLEPGSPDRAQTEPCECPEDDGKHDGAGRQQWDLRRLADGDHVRHVRDRPDDRDDEEDRDGRDATPPLLRSVYLERRSMNAGERNTVFVQAEDEKSGVSLVSANVALAILVRIVPPLCVFM